MPVGRTGRSVSRTVDRAAGRLSGRPTGSLDDRPVDR